MFLKTPMVARKSNMGQPLTFIFHIYTLGQNYVILCRVCFNTKNLSTFSAPNHILDISQCITNILQQTEPNYAHWMGCNTFVNKGAQMSMVKKATIIVWPIGHIET